MWSLTRMPAGRPAGIRAIVAARPKASASMAQPCSYVNRIGPSRKAAPLIRLLPAPRLAPKLARGAPFSRPTPRAALTSRRRGWVSALEVAHRLLVEQVLGAGKALAARVLVVARLPTLHARRLRHDQRPPAHERVQQAHVDGRGRRAGAGSARDGPSARREADEKGEGQAGSDRAEVHRSLPIIDLLLHERPRLPR